MAKTVVKGDGESQRPTKGPAEAKAAEKVEVAGLGAKDFLEGKRREHEAILKTGLPALVDSTKAAFAKIETRFFVLSDGRFTYIVDGGKYVEDPKTQEFVEDPKTGKLMKEDPRVMVFLDGSLRGWGIPLGLTGRDERTDVGRGLYDAKDMAQLKGLKPLPSATFGVKEESPEGLRLEVLIINKDELPMGSNPPETLDLGRLHRHTSGRLSSVAYVNPALLSGQQMLEFSDQLKGAEKALDKVMGGEIALERPIKPSVPKPGEKPKPVVYQPNIEDVLKSFAEVAEKVRREGRNRQR